MEQVQRRKMSKDKHTVPEERFTIDCSFCGFLTTERTYVAAMETAQRLKLRHKASDEKITIFDRLAQRGVCNTWDIDGRCIGYKEWREVPHEPVKGEQAGMLGVPGKVHTQKRPYEAGQMEIGSYTKYKEAMPFIKVGDKVRYIGKIKGRRGTWLPGVWLEQGMEGTVIEYHPRIILGEEPIEAYAVVKFDNGATTAIDAKDEGERWERVTLTKPSESDLHWKTVAELKEMCSQRGLPTDGKKEDLIRRLK